MGVDHHQTVAIEQRDVVVLTNRRPAVMQWFGLVPVSTEPIAIDAPGSGVELHAV
jgi:hypothetical protein